VPSPNVQLDTALRWSGPVVNSRAGGASIQPSKLRLRARDQAGQSDDFERLAI
jgi:hypothetical protein